MASSSERSWIHDVFLSFRGTDTRKNFTDHLYTALVNAGVRTFRDDPDLERGDNIPEALIRAIQGSRISVVVISQGYADSPWCLDELVRIMERRRELKQKVLPIFYHVDPSDVRHQKGSFGKAFEKYEALRRRTQDEISGWRSALEEVADLSGCDVLASNDGSEAKCVKGIVDEVSRMLNKTYLNVAVYPVGIESRIKDICNSLSDGKEDDVRMVGIWGMGGSGKTSLAKAVYNKFYHTFENMSFLGNVRETAKESNGKIILQERLLSDILKPTKIEVGNADRGIVVIKERLGFMKVFVIVDDVDEMDQLTALAIRHNSFGPGSRIVITTRDRRVLELLNVDKIHLAQEMKEEEALELFSWHAFQNPCIDSRFLELTRRVLDYCGGLPLALEVLGSFLYKESISHWKSTLKKLEKFPDDKIHKILKISFDALDEDQKEIFLHICCFFVGMDKNYVTEILYGCGHFSEVSIRGLLQRCLVTVSEKDKLIMHDLLRDMGREIVRVESPREPEERRRLWHQEDIVEVLTEESGTKKIEGLALNLQRYDKKRFRTKAFQRMKKLKLLQLNYVQLNGDYDYLSKQLRWLCWHGFSLSTIGNEFLNEQNLVSIDLQYSKLERVWEQSRLLEKLKILNLSHSHYLTHTPDFSNIPNLKYLILKDCRSLSEIDESIGLLRRLVLVNLKDCIMLKDLPKSFYKLKSVETLILSGCWRFQNLSDDIGNMASMTTLDVSGTAMSELPSTLVRMKSLKSLTARNLTHKALLRKPANNSSQKELNRMKHCFPEVPRNRFRALPQGLTTFFVKQGLTTLNMRISGVHSHLELLPSDHCTAHSVTPHFSKASRQSILQGWTASGDGGFFFLRNRFVHVSNSEQVFFQVPQFIGCNLEAFTVCVICSLFNENRCPSGISIFVTNYTKLINFAVRPAHLSAVRSAHLYENEVVWQVNLSNNEFNLEGGDFVEVEAVIGSGFPVKYTEVYLEWPPEHSNENKECEPIRYECESSLGPASSFHHDLSDFHHNECESSLV